MARRWRRGMKSQADEVEVLDYPACPGAAATEWNGWVEAGDDGAATSAQGRAEVRAETAAEVLHRARTKRKRRSGPLRADARGAAKKAARRSARRRLRRWPRGGAAEAATRRTGCALCRGERALSAAVEQEVVKLALAVASRILRREAQMDPLLLDRSSARRAGTIGGIVRGTAAGARGRARVVAGGDRASAAPGDEAASDGGRRNAPGRLQDREPCGNGGPGRARAARRRSSEDFSIASRPRRTSARDSDSVVRISSRRGRRMTALLEHYFSAA